MSHSHQHDAMQKAKRARGKKKGILQASMTSRTLVNHIHVDPFDTISLSWKHVDRFGWKPRRSFFPFAFYSLG